LLPPAHATVPTPLSIEQVVAFVMPLHESVEDCPLLMLVGFALNDPIAGLAGAVTVMVALAVVLPPVPVAVSV
jgi:hypothetical protein